MEIKAVSKWTFLSNHAHVIVLLAMDSDTVLREIAQKIGITERAVQGIISDLEQSGFITRERVGRRNQYKLNLKKPLRHVIENKCTIGEIINTILKKNHS